MISIQDISKSFDQQIALSEVSLEVEKGELFGLIGPDGAGKTTLFRILTTLIKPDKGRAQVGKYDIEKEYRKIRSSIGYMPGKFSLYTDLTVQENLQFFATVFGVTIEENYELIEDIYELLAPFKNRRAGDLSGGMKQKLALCCALIHEPSIMLLDEPTTGVDPVSRKDFWDILQSLKEREITIMVSTPYMDEAALCDRIALIQKGKILSVDTPEDTRRAFSKKLYRIKSNKDMYTLLNELEDYSRTDSAFAFGDAVHYTDKIEEQVESSLKEHLHDHDLEIESINAGVEDRFMELMQKKGDE
jgi:ABC-type multidrug transport system ATPase subunit